MSNKSQFFVNCYASSAGSLDASISSLTSVIACPSQFVPRHVFLLSALGLLAPKPMPHILSLGLASTSVVPTVDISFSFKSLF